MKNYLFTSVYVYVVYIFMYVQICFSTIWLYQFLFYFSCGFLLPSVQADGVSVLQHINDDVWKESSICLEGLLACFEESKFIKEHIGLMEVEDLEEGLWWETEERGFAK